jgi:integrase/recombinase XerD
MSGLVDQWLDWLATERGRSDNTVATYARTLRTLPNAETATREDVEAWWKKRATKAATTRANELSAVRAFYRWCQRFEHRTDDPTIRLDAPKMPQTVHRFVSRTDLNTLLTNLAPDLGRAVALGAYAGLRVSEAAVLDWNDVDTELGRLIVKGKGNKERFVGLPAVLLDRLLPETGGNVIAAGGKPYTGHTLQMKVNKAIQGAGVDATFHALRHRFGTIAAGSGVPLTSLARAMGHSSPTTTAIYVGATDSDLDLIAEAVTR